MAIPARPLEHASNDIAATRALGFWFYLMSDAILFAVLFVTYAAMSHSNALGPTGKELFDLPRTVAETALLLTSSLTCGFATIAAHASRSKAVVVWLMITSLLGLGFVGLELSEFSGMIQQGAGPDRSGFLSSFFTLVGTHGLHVSAGLIWLLVLAAQIVVKQLTPMVQSRLARWALFWHFLDIVWIGIYSVVYLPGML